MARKIDEMEHQLSKEKNTSSWYEKHARMLDMELDDEILKETHVDTEQLGKKKRLLANMKRELESQLKKMIIPKFCSTNYLQTDSYNRIKSINRE